MTVELLLNSLEEVEMEVLTAMNGLQGVETVVRNKQSPFNFILLDLQMPVLDGYGVSFIIEVLISYRLPNA
jgi:CheY-like chemotaxis protein